MERKSICRGRKVKLCWKVGEVRREETSEIGRKIKYAGRRKGK